MKSLLPSVPPERLIDPGTSDGQNKLRALRDRYLKLDMFKAASAVAVLIDDTAVDATEPILSDVVTGSVFIGQYADRDPVQGAAIDHALATGEGLFTTLPKLSSEFAPEDTYGKEI